MRLDAPTVNESSRLKYQLAMFDSDGTLADTLPWMRSVFNELAEEFGFRRVEPHEYERFRNLHGAALFRELRLPLWKVPRVVRAMRHRMSSHTGSFQLYPGMAEALERLTQAGMHVAVVSTNSRENVERILGARCAPLVSYFGCGVSMFGKAARLRQTVRACGVGPQASIYIGDEVRDAEAAHAAGVAFGAVVWGQHNEATLRTAGPTEVFSSVADLAHRLVAPTPRL
ncbi:MAG: HAD hydrolase-like protein [Verrucomicrobiota bacterium]